MVGEPAYDRQEGQSALSVSAAMALAKGALEGVTVRMVGEVSELSNKAGYKAVYFTIKDQSASLPCMMWNNRFQASGVRLSIGCLVEVTGRFTLYAAKGRMNFDVFSISLAGEGKLRMQVAELAKQLQAQGLMDPQRKRPIPAFPECIGLVTSPRGAAVHDVLRTLRRRFPMARVLLAGVPVEGAQAPNYLCDGIRHVVDAGAEVVLVVRGGGSFEDLMPFNDESLARMIASCPVPVVTGIGHEPDTSIADMVADLRASTPTAAAEAVAPESAAVLQHLDATASRVSSRFLSRIDHAQLRLDKVRARSIFERPESLFAQSAQALDDYSQRLPLAIPRALEKDHLNLLHKGDRLMRAMPNLLEAHRRDAERMSAKVEDCGASLLSGYEAKLGLVASRLHDLSPLAVIGRGYSLVRNDEGRIVSSVSQTAAGEDVSVQVSDGELICKVLSTAKVDTSVTELKEL